jgi:hypothetical protein
MNVLVTGTPGAGKTTLVAYAHAQKDARFVDADEIRELCEWRDLETGKVLGLISEHKAVGGDDWYKKYGWYWKTDVLKQFLKDNPDAVLCGSAENIADCYKYFDKIFILEKTEEELISNLQSPHRINPFGKTPEQRKGFLNWQEYLLTEAKPYSSTIIQGNIIEDAYTSIVEHIKS